VALIRPSWCRAAVRLGWNLLADQDDLLIPAGYAGWRQRITGKDDGARDQPAGTPLIVATDVDEQATLRLHGEGLDWRGGGAAVPR
jgi:hypothetical protein